VGATPQELQATIASESQELARRIQVYRTGHDHLPVEGMHIWLGIHAAANLVLLAT
jgi:hypothetical protein